MKLAGVLLFGLLVLILIVVGVSSFVVRLNTPPPVAVQAAFPTAPAGPTVPCNDGTYAFTQQACDQARQLVVSNSQSQQTSGAANDAAAQPTSPPPPPPTTEATQPPPPPTTQPTTAPPPRPVTMNDGRYDSGTADVSLSADQAIIGQSYEVNGQGGGCQVFGGNGPASVSVVDGEWWVFATTLSDDDLQRLMGVAEQNQQNDPQAQCGGGSNLTRI